MKKASSNRSPLLLYALIPALAVINVVWLQATLPYGAGTPQEALARYDEAVRAHDAGGAARFIEPATRKQLIVDVLIEITTVLRALNPENPEKTAGGGAMLPDRTQNAERANYRAAVDVAHQTLKPFGLEGVLSLDAKAIETNSMVAAALAKEDTVVLIAKLFVALSELGSKLFNADDSPLHADTIGPARNFEIIGDNAAATARGETVQFKRVEGRWYVVRPFVWQLPHMPKGA